VHLLQQQEQQVATPSVRQRKDTRAGLWGSNRAYLSELVLSKLRYGYL
jgi:hypothetical protein